MDNALYIISRIKLIQRFLEILKSFETASSFLKNGKIFSLMTFNVALMQLKVQSLSHKPIMI